MEKTVDALDELEGSIKSLLDRLTTVEKNSQEHKDLIMSIEKKSERMMKANSGTAAGSLQNNILNGLQTNVDVLKKSVSSRSNESFEISQKAAATDMTAFPSGAAASITDFYSQIQRPNNRPVHLRELFGIRDLTTGQIEYLYETSYDGGVAGAPFGSYKSQVDYNLTAKVLPAITLAGYVRISSQIVEDIPTALAYISQRLAENLLTYEDSQILNGTGIGTQLSGVLLAANHTAKSGSATVTAEKWIEAAAQLATFNRVMTTLVVHPTEYFAVLKTIAASVYSLPYGFSVTADGKITVLGVPVVWSNALTAGNYLAIDNSAANLWQRQALNVQVFNQDGDNVTRNMLTIRCENRVALTVYDKQGFIYTS